ncbi:tubulin epsilon and delta complex protein 1 [Brachionichthys hirsutus]|uniref:tubulin epsilon and delta complex protein 1 n=1 Tax=Brachionichthys hirsutus TaxID=412623 RepID=UPI0036047450
MPRTKSSVEVRQVIGVLCRLLAATGLDPVPEPETFRRAKFGGGAEVEDQFWQLLVSVLQKAGMISCDARVQSGGERWKPVAAGLWQTGYRADWLFEEEEEGGGRPGGRRPLLALGWLLATGALERLLARQVERVDKTLLTPSLVDPPQFSTELPVSPASLRKLQWLVGRLRAQQRILLSALEERARALHAVLFASLPSSDHSETRTRKDCVCVQQLCDLLQAYLQWKREEKVFWTWMDSVVDGDLTDPEIQKSTLAPVRSQRMCHRGNQGLEELNMLLRWPTGQRTGRRDSERRGAGGERLLGESSASSLPPLLSSVPALAPPLRVYRAKLRTGGLRSGPGSPDELPSSQAVQLLTQAEAALLERRDKQRLANRMQLQEMVSRLDTLVLIPP